jgi:ElaB/YqjD/DUF883 family membrane-anchored ribosome-binding protein
MNTGEATVVDDESIATKSTLVNQSGQPLSRANDTTNVEDQAAQIAALKAEIESLSKSVNTIATTAKGLAVTSIDAAVDDAEQMLKRNVFAAVGTAAFLGYLWGRTR